MTPYSVENIQQQSKLYVLYSVIFDTVLSPSCTVRCLEATESILFCLSIHVSFTIYCRVSQSIHLSPGYGFVDFDAPGSAERAVQALQAQGIQAQMAKVRLASASLIFRNTVS